MGESTGQRRARQAANSSVETLGQGYTAYTGDPLQDLLRSLTESVVSEPLQSSTAALYPGMAAEAHRGARNFLNERYDQLSSVGAGYRGGSARAAEITAAGGLGDALARIGPQLAVQEDERRLNAITQAINLGRAVLGDQYGWYSQISNAQLGQASALAGLAQQPTPIGSLFGGLGGILGQIASVPGNFLGTVGR